MGRFQLELIHLYFPPSSHLIYTLFLAVLFSFSVLYCIDGVGIAAQCTVAFFKIYSALPNLGITKTWISRLNFAQRPIFLSLRFFNEPEISDSDSQLKVPPRGLVLRIYTSWKIHRPQPDLNPRTFLTNQQHIVLYSETTKYLTLRKTAKCRAL